MKEVSMNVARPISAAVNNKPASGGFIAFTSLLVISAVTLAIAVSISLLGVNEAQSSLDFKKGQEVLKIAEAGAEEAFLRLRDNAAWDPEGAEIPLPGVAGSCAVDVSGAGNDRTVDITAAISGPPQYLKKLQITAKRVGNSLNLTSWQEVE